MIAKPPSIPSAAIHNTDQKIKLSVSPVGGETGLVGSVGSVISPYIHPAYLVETIIRFYIIFPNQTIFLISVK
jgi:hypothetical protein